MKSVVIVEDNEACAITLQIALESLPGVEVRLASSASAALLMLFGSEANPVGAIVSDLQLPGMDGLDLLSRLRADIRYSRVPVLIISGDSDPSTPLRVLESGADAFFTKPYSPAEVRRKLEQLLAC